MTTNDEQAPYGPTVQQAADRLMAALKDADKPTERLCEPQGDPLTPPEYTGIASMIQPTERAPMLSDEGLGEMFSADGDRDYQEDQQWFGGKCVRDFYEAKITSGELILASGGLVSRREAKFQWDQVDKERREYRDALNEVTAKMASGELRVVKTCTDLAGHFDDWTCSNCHEAVTVCGAHNFCPGCGAQIVK